MTYQPARRCICSDIQLLNPLMYGFTIVYIYIYIYISLGTLVPNSRDRQGKLWLLKKQKMALKTTLQ